jgi:hypothetical protein
MASLSELETAAAELAHPNLMKQRLNAGEVVTAMSIRYSRGIEIVGYAKAAGMNGVLIDLEHRYDPIFILPPLYRSARELTVYGRESAL